jgi:hypothetical protein
VVAVRNIVKRLPPPFGVEVHVSGPAPVIPPTCSAVVTNPF